MNEENNNLEVIEFLYGELDDKSAKELRRAADKDPQLSEDLRSFERTRAIYREVSLPDPPDALSEAILRQEKILRTEPEPFWASMWRVLWHPAFGAAAVVTLAIGAGVFMTFSRSPMEAMAPAPASSTEGTSGAGALAGAVAEQEATPTTVTPQYPPAEPQAEQVADAPAERALRFESKSPAAGDKREGALAAFEEQKIDGRSLDEVADLSVDSPKPVLKGKVAPEPAATAYVPADRADSADLGAARSSRGLRDEESRPAPAPSRKPSRKKARARPNAVASGFDVGEGEEAIAREEAAVGGRPGSAGQLTDPSLLAEAPARSPRTAGSAGNVAPTSPAGKAGTGSRSSLSSSEDADDSYAPKSDSVGAFRLAPKQSRTGPVTKLQKELQSVHQSQRIQTAVGHLEAGQSAYGRRRYVEALDYFQRAQQLDPSPQMMPRAMVMEARTLAKLKRTQEAVAMYEQVLKRYPRYLHRETVLAELVSLHESSGNSSLAKRAQRRFSSEGAAAADGPAAPNSDTVNAAESVEMPAATAN